MSYIVNVPTVGESISEVTISAWQKNDGDMVAMDEVLAELESDKATFELTAPVNGRLKIKKPAGETAAIGDAVCEIEEVADASAEAPETPAAAPAASAPKATGAVKDMVVPTVGESITEVTISQWMKKEGDFVAIDEVLAEIESDKATFELPAEASGILRIVAAEGSTIGIGDLICKIEVMEGGSPSEAAPAPTAGGDAAAPDGHAVGHASPAAAKVLKERGLAADQVKGTGVGGRVTKQDALAAAAAPQQQAPKPQATPQPAAPPPPGERGERRVKLSSLRKTIARRLVAVKNETALLTTFNEVDMKPIMDLRAKYKESFKKKYEVGLGFMSFFTKAVCYALREFPAVNAYLDGDEIIYHDYCDISIAVSTPKGLVVPVIRDAHQLSMADIEREVVRLATRGRDGKLSIGEMTGGTFSITNGGVFGSMLSTPIINPPQSAILGMHNIVNRPVVVDGEVAVRPIMYVAMSYDHRIIDGKESVSFLVKVKEMLEDPGRLVLEI